MPTVLAGMKIQSVKQYFIKLDDDRKGAWISGCSFMPSGDLVLCDHSNSKLKLLDRAFKVKDSLRLNDGLWSVSVIDDDNVIVTLPFNKQLQYVHLVPRMNAGHVIQLDKKCWGVAVADNEIYVSCHNAGKGEVRILDLNGKLRRQLGVDKDRAYNFRDSEYLTVSTTGKKVFVSNYWTSIITCMTSDGNIINQYNHGDLSHPEALFVDACDNIVVCGHTSHNVLVITADGRKYDLISIDDGIRYPYSIAFREADNTLVVGCFNLNKIFCFKLSR